MAGDGKGTLQLIIENVRDAGVAFGRRFAPPANVRDALKLLLADLGVKNPEDEVLAALAAAAAAWHDLANSLSGVSLNFANPPAAIAGLAAKAKTISDGIARIVQAPQDAVAGLGASAATLKDVFAKRLLDYIVYEFIVSTHPKIGGAFLVLGVLRREPQVAGDNPTLIDGAQIRIFDLPQLIRAITDPRGSFLTVMRWGTDDFLARPVVDGMALLLGTVPLTKGLGPPEDVLPLVEEARFVALKEGLQASARRIVNAEIGSLAFVGLHQHGVGLLVPNPVKLQGNLIPDLGGDRLFAIQPGNPPATAAPEFAVLTALPA